ncbi:MAG: SWIM zinc finger family protein, partial [Anaerolineaceae bacterium]|nr:SWIM zinc finger family protein [Anaerolineaceae bacterium]
MTNSWTPQQVLELAPDAGSRKNAAGLASQHKWQKLQKSQEEGRLILWGEIKGSGSDPYRCQANLDGPEFNCTCPSTKRPCKHALGLFLLFTSQPDTFETGTAPDWVTAWLAKRAEAAAQRAARAEGRGSASNPVQRERKSGGRSLGRDKKIRAGLDELEIWLCDLLRQGLAAAQSQAHPFWETAAARLVDAQAPGLARLVREMPTLAASGDGWQERMLEQIARLYLAVEGYRRIESLEEDTQADLRSLVGINIHRQELLKKSGVSDAWLVMGRVIEEETNLKVQRTWLLGK